MAYQSKSFESIGPNFVRTINDPRAAADSPSIANEYAFTEDGYQFYRTFNESGSYQLFNDGGIEIVAGKKGSNGDVDINIRGSGGDICITATSTGIVKIKGHSVIIEASEDLDLKAGRNVNITSGSGRIIMKGNKIDQLAFTGNAVHDTFGKRAFSLVPVGNEYITDVFTGGIDVAGTKTPCDNLFALSGLVGIG